jgi:hypothetical protein
VSDPYNLDPATVDPGSIKPESVRDKASDEEEALWYIGRTFEVDLDDCCVAASFTSVFTGVEHRLMEQAGGGVIWYRTGYRFANGVLVGNGWFPHEEAQP